MFSLASSRKLTYPILLVSGLLLLTWLVVQFNRATISSIESPHMILLPKRHLLQAAINFENFTSLEDYYVQQHHSTNQLAAPNSYLISQLSQCRYTPNPITNHVRLPSLKILNISMVPVDDSAAEFASHKYFNPAIIPLPSHVFTTSGYRYLLVSRLVTTGHHQESHICFADICSPESTSSANTRPCTASDSDIVKSEGGLRCITKAEKVNIPPTPSRRCTGAWSTFPDIPGFHDPRIFWTGRGEPLIEVNSGSQYGCVGLWVQDLRAIHNRLEEVLGKREKGFGVRDVHHEDRELTAETHSKLDLLGLGPPVTYSHLTEITKNPRDSRSEVEKNWVLFFPTEEETWVQYDMMGRHGLDEEPQHAKSNLPASSSAEGIVGEGTHFATTQSSGSAVTTAADVLGHQEGELTSADETIAQGTTSDADLQASSVIAATLGTGNQEAGSIIEPELKAVLFEDDPAKRSEIRDDGKSVVALPESLSTVPGGIDHTIEEAPLAQISDFPESPFPKPIFVNANTSIMSETLATSPASSSTASDTLLGRPAKGGRTLAQLLSHGHTTPNLTSPLEPTCFNLTDYDHIHDAFNNSGHWHQGSNSLRLIFCTREQFRARSCIPASTTNGPIELRDEKRMNWEEYERLLTREGLVVHFSIVHRKFNNDWDLPVRYERYLLVWEARKPFRTLGISRHPILFGEERARPWTTEQDLGYEFERDAPDHMRRVATDESESLLNSSGNTPADNSSREGAYFTYTPSIAWAWRSNSEEGATQERGHEDLGTGYVGEDIVIGIGMDDVAQGFVKVSVDEVLTCLRLCSV